MYTKTVILKQSDESKNSNWTLGSPKNYLLYCEWDFSKSFFSVWISLLKVFRSVSCFSISLSLFVIIACARTFFWVSNFKSSSSLSILEWSSRCSFSAWRIFSSKFNFCSEFWEIADKTVLMVDEGFFWIFCFCSAGCAFS